MTDATLSYARALRRMAEVQAGCGGEVILTLNPPSALYLASVIEHGCRRSQYVRTVQAEAEKLRDLREDELMRAQDLNAAADRALARAERYRRRMLVVAVGFIGGFLLGSIWAVLA